MEPIIFWVCLTLFGLAIIFAVYGLQDAINHSDDLFGLEMAFLSAGLIVVCVVGFLLLLAWYAEVR